MQNPTKAKVTAQRVNVLSSILILQNNTHDETCCCHWWLGVLYFFWVELGVFHLSPAVYQRATASYRKTSFNWALEGGRRFLPERIKPWGLKMDQKELYFLFILQKCKQVNEMVSYTFLHPSAVKTLFIHQLYSKMYILFS